MMPRWAGRTGLLCFLSEASSFAMLSVLALCSPKKLCSETCEAPVSASTCLLLRGPGQAAKLADELPDRDVAAIGDVRRHVAAEAALVVPVSRRRPRRQPLCPRRIRRLDVDLRARRSMTPEGSDAD